MQRAIRKGGLYLFIISTILIFSVSCKSRKREGNQISAHQALRHIYYGQVMYKERHGGFAETFGKLCSDEEIKTYLGQRILEMDKKPYFGYLRSDFFLDKDEQLKTETHFSIYVFPEKNSGLNRDGDDCFSIDQEGTIRHSLSPQKIPNKTSPIVEKL
jgi:hypothetical protein